MLMISEDLWFMKSIQGIITVFLFIIISDK